MKTKLTTKALVLFLSLAFISVAGFSQNDDRKELAKEAATSLTESMKTTLSLTDVQEESVKQYNLSYALSLFTTVPLTDDVIQEFDKTLDVNMKEALSDEQYGLWNDNKEAWLNAVKSKLPEDETIDSTEEVSPDF